MAITNIIADITGDGVSATHRTQRKRDDSGIWMIEWTPNSPPGTVQIRYQVQIHPAFSGWATIKLVTEAELGTTAGPFYFAEQVPLAAYCRIVVSNSDDAANTVLVGLQE